jgi:hypothetical protein
MRFHRLRQTIEGTTSKPRQPKNDDGSSGKGRGKVSYTREAKDAAKQQCLADFSEDDEEPLAHLRAKRRLKYEEDSGNEYIPTEPESKPDIKKRIKHEENADEAVKQDANEGVMIKDEDVTKSVFAIKEDPMNMETDKPVKKENEAEVVYIKTESKDV